MWEEQLVDPPNHYLTCVIAPGSLVLNEYYLVQCERTTDDW